MAVREIWDISPELFFINFEITSSVSIFTNKHHTITSTTANQRGNYKTEGDYKTAG